MNLSNRVTNGPRRLQTPNKGFMRRHLLRIMVLYLLSVIFLMCPLRSEQNDSSLMICKAYYRGTDEILEYSTRAWKKLKEGSEPFVMPAINSYVKPVVNDVRTKSRPMLKFLKTNTSPAAKKVSEIAQKQSHYLVSRYIRPKYDSMFRKYQPHIKKAKEYYEKAFSWNCQAISALEEKLIKPMQPFVAVATWVIKRAIFTGFAFYIDNIQPRLILFAKLLARWLLNNVWPFIDSKYDYYFKPTIQRGMAWLTSTVVYEKILEPIKQNCLDYVSFAINRARGYSSVKSSFKSDKATWKVKIFSLLGTNESRKSIPNAKSYIVSVQKKIEFLLCETKLEIAEHVDVVLRGTVIRQDNTIDTQLYLFQNICKGHVSSIGNKIENFHFDEHADPQEFLAEIKSSTKEAGKQIVERAQILRRYAFGMREDAESIINAKLQQGREAFEDVQKQALDGLLEILEQEGLTEKKYKQQRRRLSDQVSHSINVLENFTSNQSNSKLEHIDRMQQRFVDGIKRIAKVAAEEIQRLKTESEQVQAKRLDDLKKQSKAELQQNEMIQEDSFKDKMVQKGSLKNKIVQEDSSKPKTQIKAKSNKAWANKEKQRIEKIQKNSKSEMEAKNSNFEIGAQADLMGKETLDNALTLENVDKVKDKAQIMITEYPNGKTDTQIPDGVEILKNSLQEDENHRISALSD